MFLVLFIIVFFFLRKVDKRSLAYFFALIVLVSLAGNAFVETNYIVDTSDVLHFIWILIVFAFVIMPWKSYSGLHVVTCGNHKKLRAVTIVLIVFFFIQLIGCAVLSYYVLTRIDDINRFKYVEGTTAFYYSLGINLTPFMLATLFYPMSYIMVPLHLYYLSKGKKKLAIWCFIASLLSVAYGLTYFSRAHLIHYVFIYIGSFWLLRNTLPRKSEKTLKKLILIGSSLILAYFVFISLSRFADHDYSARSAMISDNSVVNSIFDYLVMWWPNSEELFGRFNWDTLHGQIALQDIYRLLSMFGIHVGTTGEALMKQRELILHEYSGSFIGVGEYFLYDFGPIISIVILFIYYSVVKNLRPRKGKMTIQRVFTITILGLLPTFAIFYSSMNVILQTLLFLLPINMYLNAQNRNFGLK